MPIFCAIKVHYDHRSSLPPHLKYSVVPTREEYDEYLKLFAEENVGGNGFHECINFAPGESDTLRFYIPPTCIPAEKYHDEEFVFFSFTYKGDREMPACVIGVHAGAQLVAPRGVARGAPHEIEGVEPLVFHAEAPSDLATLTIPALPYEVGEGVYTPPLDKWGNGLRYLTAEHAGNIVRDSIKQARAALRSATPSQREVLERQIDVLQRISVRYGLGTGDSTGKTKRPRQGSTGGAPDTENGYLGERLIYQRELAYVASLGQPESAVQWTSQAAPQSPFDIRTLRRDAGGIREHFLEVKTSSMGEGENVYISSRQIEFFEQNPDAATFVLVNYDGKDPAIRELTLEELRRDYDLAPVKFKLARRT